MFIALIGITDAINFVATESLEIEIWNDQATCFVLRYVNEYGQ